MGGGKVAWRLQEGDFLICVNSGDISYNWGKPE